MRERMTCLLRLVPLIAVLLLAACGTTPPADQALGPPKGNAQEIAELATAIAALGPSVDPEEAQRAARIAYDYTHQLALEYQITDPPLVHNTKVNLGLKPRGLCWHWAEDIERRLDDEGFETLEMHRAIANADNPILIDHSTAIVSARGDTMLEGIVLDPWRNGGVLFWEHTREDTRYDWQPQREVLLEKQQRAAARSAGGARP